MHISIYNVGSTTLFNPVILQANIILAVYCVQFHVKRNERVRKTFAKECGFIEITNPPHFCSGVISLIFLPALSFDHIVKMETSCIWSF